MKALYSINRGRLALASVLLAAIGLAACGSDADTATTRPTGDDVLSTSAVSASSTSSTETASVAAPQLAGTAWNVTEYTLPSGSLTNLWPGTEITLKFATEDAFEGSGGCNTYQGTYETTGAYDEFQDGTRDPNDGQAIQLLDLSFTERACTEPSNVMEQESEYFGALGQVGRWVLVRGSLSLRDAEGFILIFAEPAL